MANGGLTGTERHFFARRGVWVDPEVAAAPSQYGPVWASIGAGTVQIGQRGRGRVDDDADAPLGPS
jgi:hypothetical protein